MHLLILLGMESEQDMHQAMAAMVQRLGQVRIHIF
jgi:hypothetical protein